MTQSNNSRLTRFVDALRRHSAGTSLLLGPEAEKYALCTTGLHRRILGAIRPTNSAEVQDIVRAARDSRTPIYPISTGHNWGYGTANPIVDDCLIVDLSRLNRVLNFDAHLGIVTIEPGVTQGELAEYLERHQAQFMAPVTGAGPSCSVLANALERGYGITPTTDHFLAVMRIEAILPNGDRYQSALSDAGAIEVDHLYKWGLGAYLDGMFTQSGFGIVTQMTIALARRPGVVEAFVFDVDEDSRLEVAVRAVHEILTQLPGVVGGINLMNDYRLLAMSAAHPRTRDASDFYLDRTRAKQLCAARGIRAWTGLGALYGAPPIARAARAIVAQVLRKARLRHRRITHGRIFSMMLLSRVLTPRASSRLKDLAEQLHETLRVLEGYPSEISLRLAYWKLGYDNTKALDPAKDGCGLIWYPPLVPMKPDRVREFVQLVVGTCIEHRVEPLITLSSMSERCFDSSVPILFNRADPDECTLARSCHDALLERGLNQGFVPYRLGIHSMAQVTQASNGFWQLVARLKQSVDDFGIMSPGRYVP